MGRASGDARLRASLLPIAHCPTQLREQRTMRQRGRGRSGNASDGALPGQNQISIFDSDFAHRPICLQPVPDRQHFLDRRYGDNLKLTQFRRPESFTLPVNSENVQLKVFPSHRRPQVNGVIKIFARHERKINRQAAIEVRGVLIENHDCATIEEAQFGRTSQIARSIPHSTKSNSARLNWQRSVRVFALPRYMPAGWTLPAGKGTGPVEASRFS